MKPPLAFKLTRALAQCRSFLAASLAPVACGATSQGSLWYDHNLRLGHHRRSVLRNGSGHILARLDVCFSMPLRAASLLTSNLLFGNHGIGDQK
jgi:hypothetical protein